MSNLQAVTGAFSYTGKYIAAKLLAAGAPVITLTGHPRQDLFAGQVRSFPFNFQQPEQLSKALQGTDTLYNTYWVRFERGETTFAQAVENTKTMFQVAAKAGVKRIVHISIANPTAGADRQLPYYMGKAALEENLKASGLSYAIIRPTVVFSREDILINNIVWLLKRMPFFAVPGAGKYQLQPVFVEDLAEIAVRAGQSRENMIIDAVGPEKYTFTGLIDLIKEIIREQSGNTRAKGTGIIHVPPLVALYCAKLVGLWSRDVLLTKDELAGLMADLLISDQAPAGKTSFQPWLRANINCLGNEYASELKRHFPPSPFH
ncbi:MAG: NAD(P)H-binding protein [Firmicutes bacterium]|nr:NAD(P)H-binding protein [Bacillota bacterium]